MAMGIGVGNRNFKGPFCLGRKVPKTPLRGQSFLLSDSPGSPKYKNLLNPIPAKKVLP